MKPSSHNCCRVLPHRVLDHPNKSAHSFFTRLIACKALFATLLIYVLLLSVSQSFAKSGGGKPIPDISVVSLDGDTLLLKEICKDKPSFIYLWATWCKVCSKEMKNVFKLQNDLGQDVRILGIAWKDTAEAIRTYFAKKKAVLPSYIDHDGSVFEAFGAAQTPSMVIVSKTGEVVFSGFASFRKLRRILAKQINND